MAAVRIPRDDRRLAVCGLAAVHVGLLLWVGARAAPTVDEYGHLAAGLSYWEFGRFDLYRVNPPLTELVAAAPVALAGYEPDWSAWEHGPTDRTAWSVGEDWLDANGERGLRLFRLARATTAAWSVLGLCVCYRWAGERFGPAGGVLAAALWAFNPTVLTHGALITPDVPAAAAGLAAAYAFGRFLRSPTAAAALRAGVLLGAANLTKTTWVLLFALWPLAAGLTWARRRGGVGRRLAGRWAAGTGGALAVGLYLLNGGYGFERVGRPLGAVPFVSETFAGPAAGEPGAATRRRRGGEPVRRDAARPAPAAGPGELGPRRRRAEAGLRDAPPLLPVRRVAGGRVVVLRTGGRGGEGAAGAVRPAGAGGLGRGGGRGRPRLGPAFWLPPLAVTAAVSAQTHMSHHPRYLLPAYGFAVAFAGGAVRFGRTPARRAVLAAVCLAAAIEPLAVMPWPHAFANAAAGGPADGWRLLDNSGMDWGQGDAAAAAWARAHGLRLDGAARFRADNSALLGLPPDRPPSRPRPGTWAIGASPLATDEYARWRDLAPAAVVGGNARVYVVE